MITMPSNLLSYQIYDSGIQFKTEYLTKEVAYFLGNIFSSNESVHAYKSFYWIAPVRYNYKYATRMQIEEHFGYVKQIAANMEAQTLMAENIRGTALDSGKFRLPGFGTFFKSQALVNLHDSIPKLKSAIENSDNIIKQCFLLGVFDGRGSIDINKKTYDIRYIVLDCPTNEIGNFLYDILSQSGFSCNYNTARDRLEGGTPRYPQIRIRDSEKYISQIGFISTKKFSVIEAAFRQTYSNLTIVDATNILPGLKKIITR